MARLQRHHAPPSVGLTHEQLHALAGEITQFGEAGPGQIGQRELIGCSTPEADELKAETEPACSVAPHQLMRLERHRQSVSGGTWQTRCGLEASKVERPIGERAEDGHTFVNHTDSRYTLHIREFYLRM